MHIIAVLWHDGVEIKSSCFFGEFCWRTWQKWFSGSVNGVSGCLKVFFRVEMGDFSDGLGLTVSLFFLIV